MPLPSWITTIPGASSAPAGAAVKEGSAIGAMPSSCQARIGRVSRAARDGRRVVDRTGGEG